MSSNQPPRLVRKWESLEYGLQFLISYPVMVVVISVLHWTALSQPILRGIAYGVFWALPAAILITMASQNESRKRRTRERDQDDAPSDDGVA